MKAESLSKAVEYLNEHGFRMNGLKSAVVCGSGLSQNLEKYARILDEWEYKEIPGFPQTTVEGHSGKLLRISFNSGAGDALVFSGRVHLYEGISVDEVLFGIRLAHILGIEKIILTCSVGGLKKSIAPYDLGLIIDHIDFQLFGTITGEKPTGGIYCEDLILKLEKSARENGIGIFCGVLASVLGPVYETPAEARMLEFIGADWVSMSIVKEAFEAHRLGLKVAGITVVTNMVQKILDTENRKMAHKNVLEKAKIGSDCLWKLLSGSRAIFR